MASFTLRAALAAGALVALAGPALAFGGGSGSGSGLSPYAAETGNDRSAGVNNGNYRDPRYDPYIRAYGHRDRSPPPPRGYYGYPY